MFIKICEKMGMSGCTEEYRFHPERRWRCDYCFPEIGLAIEIEGGLWKEKSRHFHGNGAINDMEKYNALTEAGIYLLRYQPNKIDYEQIFRIYKNLMKSYQKSQNSGANHYKTA